MQLGVEAASLAINHRRSLGGGDDWMGADLGFL